MSLLDEMKDAVSDDAKDLRLNLGSVLQAGALDPRQRHGVALTSAYFLRAPELVRAILDEGAPHLTPETIADARAAASIMAMNTVYYRFRHLVGKESYSTRPAGLRMSRMARPATSKADFELFSMACAALAGCETCIKAHEQSLLKEGLTEEHVHDSVRIASVVSGFLVGFSSSPA
jgi:alkyl hydroperoxide reductase subunit D